MKDCKSLMDQVHEIASRHHDQALEQACQELESTVATIELSSSS